MLPSGEPLQYLQVLGRDFRTLIEDFGTEHHHRVVLGADALLGGDLHAAVGLGLLVRHQERGPGVDLAGGEGRRGVLLLQWNSGHPVGRYTGLRQGLQQDVLALARRIHRDPLADQVGHRVNSRCPGGDDAALVLARRILHRRDPHCHILGQRADDRTERGTGHIELPGVEQFQHGAETRCGGDPFDPRAQWRQSLVEGPVPLGHRQWTRITRIGDLQHQLGSRSGAGGGPGAARRHQSDDGSERERETPAVWPARAEHRGAPLPKS